VAGVSTPTEPGYYWLDDTEGGDPRPVELVVSRLPHRPGLRVVEMGIPARDAWPVEHRVYRGARWVRMVAP
jgi:hypothetical protein